MLSKLNFKKKRFLKSLKYSIKANNLDPYAHKIQEKRENPIRKKYNWLILTFGILAGISTVTLLAWSIIQVNGQFLPYSLLAISLVVSIFWVGSALFYVMDKAVLSIIYLGMSFIFVFFYLFTHYL